MVENVNGALKKYESKNQGALPDQIIIYRDGIGGSSMMEKCLKTEVEQVTSAIISYAQYYQPQIIYIFVNRNITHRLFYKDQAHVINPGPGTVLDMGLVENQGDQIFDFFLIPHKATVATA